MFKIKKMLSMGLTAVMLSAVLPLAAEADETVFPETVMYENDFSGADIYAAFPSFQNDELAIGGFDKDAGGTVTDNVEGNNPSLNPEGYLWFRDEQHGFHRDGRTILADFTLGGIKEGLSEGVVKMSYDFMIRSGSAANPSSTGFNMTNDYKGGVLLGLLNYQAEGSQVTEPSLGVKNTLGDWVVNNTHNMTKLTPMTWYSLDLIADIEAGTLSCYLNGQKLKAPESLGKFKPIENFVVAMNGLYAGLDNLKISKLNRTSYEFTVDAGNLAQGYVDVIFPTAMNTAQGVFTVDGQAAETQWISVSRARISSEKLKQEGKHTLEIAGAENIFAAAPKNTKAEMLTPRWDAEHILYADDFNDVQEELLWIEGEQYNYGWRTNMVDGVEHPVVNGNPGLAVFFGKIADGKDNRGFMIDFTKSLSCGGMDVGGLTKGKMKFGFDFALKKAEWDSASFGVNMKTTATGNLCAEFSSFTDETGVLKGRIKTKKDASSWLDAGEYSNEEYVDLETIHTFEAVLDLDVPYTEVSYYLDGKKLPGTTKYWQDNVPNITFCPNEYFSYLDNLKVSWLTEGSFGVLGARAEAGEKYVDIYTSEAAAADLAANQVLVNGENPKSVSVLTVPGVYSADERYLVRAELNQPIEAGKTYAVSLVNTAKSFADMPINPEHTSAVVQAEELVSLKIEADTVRAVISNNDGTSRALPVVIVAEYAENGSLKTAEIHSEFTVDGQPVQTLEPGKRAELAVDITGYTGVVKAFVWEKENMKPLASAAVR